MVVTSCTPFFAEGSPVTTLEWDTSRTFYKRTNFPAHFIADMDQDRMEKNEHRCRTEIKKRKEKALSKKIHHQLEQIMHLENMIDNYYSHKTTKAHRNKT